MSENEIPQGEGCGCIATCAPTDPAATFIVADLPTEDELLDRYAKHVLALCSGNKTHAARKLGIDRRSLYRRLGLDYGAKP